METSNPSACPICGGAQLNWRVLRTGRRGQPLAGRSILWSCGTCQASWNDDAADAERHRSSGEAAAG